MSCDVDIVKACRSILGVCLAAVPRDLVGDYFSQLEGGGLPSRDGLSLWKLLGVLVF